MSMKRLVEGECGGPNALVTLSNNYGTSNQRIASQPSRGASSLLPNSSIGEQFANDFLSQKARAEIAPATFNMQLLSSQLPKQSSSTSLASNWSNEYGARPANQMASQWSSQYTARPSMESAWSAASGQLQYSNQPHSSSIDSGMWSAEFLETVDTSLQSAQGASSRLADSWAEEFSDQVPDVWRNMDSEWDSIQRNIELAQGDSISGAKEDKYIHQNPFLTAADPMADGDGLMTAGDLGGAMLAYEAAVQRNPQDAKSTELNHHDLLEAAVVKCPEDANAWCRLGLSHAENEHDSKAIAAFNNCLKIEPKNQEALLALSVSLANESMENDALTQLDRWVSVHLGQEAIETPTSATHYSSFLDHTAFAKIEERFLNAARQQQGAPDAALQNALGVLYNLNRNFDRAVDCVRLAISSQPQDPRLWNRLGATLANGDRTAEAVSAYREALTRYPTYVRARYNLGISCMHLNSYREAIEHFVSALELQKGGSEGHSIWPTLRSATIRMRGCNDPLLRALDSRDLAAYKNALQGIPNEKH